MEGYKIVSRLTQEGQSLLRNWQLPLKSLIGDLSSCEGPFILLQRYDNVYNNNLDCKVKFENKMGGCLSTNERNKNFDKEPEETVNLDPSKFPKIRIHTLLAKLKLKRCVKYQFINIRINFGGFEQFQLKAKRLTNETARWQIQHKSEFQTTEYEMRKKFFILELIEEGKVIGQLKINLYLLAVGPYHQDFLIPLPNSQQTRISFNLKISQEVSMKLTIKQVRMRPNDKEFQGDQFVFCLRSVIGDNIEETNTSYPFLIDFDNKKQFQKLKKIPSEKQEIMKNNQLKQNKLKRLNSLRSTAPIRQNIQTLHVEILWQAKDQKEMPYFESNIPLFDLHGSTFNFVFYSLNNNKRDFHSECFISYNKLASYVFQEVMNSNNNQKWEERKVQIELKTWDHGQETGNAKLFFLFSIQKHIKQMQVCVRTQKGILQSSPVFRQTLLGGSHVPEQISELQKLGIQIENMFIKISQNKSSDNIKLTNKFKEAINGYLRRQKEILQTSAKESKQMFVYKDEISLKKSQKILIQLGFRIKRLLQEDIEDISPLCWQILIILIKRGELTLAHMGFTNQELKMHNVDKMTEFMQRKKDAMLSYYVLMVDLLQVTFQSLDTYNYEGQMEFAQLFCAHSYFRITKFRKEVLAAITRSEDPQIQEWRGTQFNLNDSIKNNPSETQTPFSLMFDWQNHFFKVIDKEEQYKRIDKKLDQLFKENGWQQRMKKRGGAFFAFVRYWVNYIEIIAVNSKHVEWKHFPGYNRILHSFLVQLKTKHILEYSASMKKAAVTLLSNERLLNPFILIILKKTNCNDQFTVLKSFDLIDTLFTAIVAKGRSLPTSFDLKILNKSIKAVLQRDSAFSIGKVLLLLYNHYKFFPIQFRVEVALYLLSKVFFKLFLNWSKNVRCIFQHLLFIRIYHEASKPLSQINTKDLQIYRKNPQYRTEIVSRYRKLILILQNAQGFKDKIRQVKIDLYEKDAFKKLRNKINRKRKQLSGNEQYIDKKKQFANKEQYQRQLMVELAEPKLQRYNSQVVQGNLKIAVEKSKVMKKQEVIIKVKKKESKEDNQIQSERKLSFFQISLENELQPLKEQEVVYVSPALEEYQAINQMFISHVQKNKDSIPIVRLEMNLDEKQIRPQGLSEEMEW